MLREVALPAIYGFRERVLTPGHPGRPVVWPYDQDAVHYALFDGEQLLACASVTAEPMPGRAARMPYHLHSMAVEPAVQGRGLGRQVLAEIVAVVASHGSDLLWATARPSAAGFYRRCGFEVGEVLRMEPTHAVMRYVWAVPAQLLDE